MKNMFVALILVLSLLFTASVSFSEIFSYTKPEGKKPLFAITFPDTWNVKEEKNVLQAMPPDDNFFYFGIWAVKNITDIDTALKNTGEIIADLVTEIQLIKPEEIQISGISYWFIDGTGKVKDIENEVDIEVNVSIAFFAPVEKTVCIVLYFAPPYILEDYMQDLDNIIQSITTLE